MGREGLYDFSFTSVTRQPSPDLKNCEYSLQRWVRYKVLARYLLPESEFLTFQASRRASEKLPGKLLETRDCMGPGASAGAHRVSGEAL